MPGMRTRATLDSAGAVPSSPAPASTGRRRTLAIGLVALLAAAAIYGLVTYAGAGDDQAADLGADAGAPDAAPVIAPARNQSGSLRAIDPAPAASWAAPARTDTAQPAPLPVAPGRPRSGSPWGARHSLTVPGTAAPATLAPALSCLILPHTPPHLEPLQEMFTAVGTSKIFRAELDCGDVRAAYLIDPGNATQWRLTAVYTDTARLCPDATPGVYRHADGSITWQVSSPIGLRSCSLQDSLAASVWVPTTVVSESRPPAQPQP